MKQLTIKPVIYEYQNCQEFSTDFQIGTGDLLITNKRVYENYLAPYCKGATVIYREVYGKGEPNDQMVEKLYLDVKDLDYKRVIAIGGGSIQDMAKLFVLENISPVDKLFDKKFPAKKVKELIIVPTTCGTGSEVTNISILEIKSKQTKLGLADDALYADSAVMIPELLNCLPYEVFATSSIDAFIHAIESYLSPKATPYTKMYSKEAMSILISGYQKIAKHGPEVRTQLLSSFLIASNYAGIAFGNAGCGPVHALSYPLGGNYHVPHGEANYVIFHSVFNTYMTLSPNGAIYELNEFLVTLLHCQKSEIYDELQNLMNHLLPQKRLRDYDVKKEEIEVFAKSVLEKQTRLMSNSYVPLTYEHILSIYKQVY